MKLMLAFLAALIAQSAAADVLVPVRTIRPKEILTAADIALKPGEVLGALSDPSEVLGQEALIALYPGRPLRAGDIGPPAIIERNDLVILTFRQGGLTISAEGRALGRGAEGELIRVMNLASRSTVTGRIAADGSVELK